MSYGAQATNPSEPCQSCVPSTSASTWTAAPDETPCTTGATCAYGWCAPTVTQLPDSPTLLCSDGTATAIACPVAAGAPTAGQDSDSDYPAQLLTPTTHGSVIDGRTQLEWATATNPGGAVARSQALQYCQGLSTNGHSDWRLPDLRSLTALGDYGASSVIGPTLGWSNNLLVWASDLDASGGGMFFAVGAGYASSAPVTNSYSVVCVRGAAPVWNNVTLPGDGTFVDHSTGLTWQLVPNVTAGSWSAALQHCEALSLAGSTDWKLPTIKELASLLDVSGTYVPPGTAGHTYWSSTPKSTNLVNAWSVDFAALDTYATGQNVAHDTRCVRH